MVLQTPAQVGMSLDDFIRESSVQRFELWDGEKKFIMPTTFDHSEVLRLLFIACLLYEQTTKRGKFFPETTYVLKMTRPQWVTNALVPDLCYFEREQIAHFKASIAADPRPQPINEVPTLVAEVISANDRPKEIADKIQRYRNDGVRLIWIIYPAAMAVDVFRADSNTSKRLTAEDVLDGEDVLPGFSVPVRNLFSEAD